MKLLEKKNPSDKVGLGVRFLHEMIQSGMISEDNDLGINQVGSKFF